MKGKLMPCDTLFIDWKDSFRVNYSGELNHKVVKDGSDLEPRTFKEVNKFVCLSDFNLIHYLIAKDYSQELIEFSLQELKLENQPISPSVLILNQA